MHLNIHTPNMTGHVENSEIALLCGHNGCINAGENETPKSQQIKATVFLLCVACLL
jgi:hypothetical protein